MKKLTINLIIKNIFKSLEKTYQWKTLNKLLQKQLKISIDKLISIEYDNNNIQIKLSIKKTDNQENKDIVDKKNIKKDINDSAMDLINKIL